MTQPTITARNERNQSPMHTKREYKNRSRIELNTRRVRGVVALLLLLPVASWGGGVVTSCTEPLLRAAMAGGGTVTFACDGTFTLSNTIVIGTNTVLDGTGHHVTISGGDAVRVFSVATNVSFEVINLTIAHGLAGGGGGGILNLDGKVLLQSCCFYSNSAAGAPPGFFPGGGAIANLGLGTLEARFCTFFANSAAGATGWLPAEAGGAANGGAVWNSGILELSDSTFLSNSVSGGPGGTGSRGMSGGLGTTLPGGPGGAGGPGNGGGLFNAGVATLVNCSLIGNIGMGGDGGAGGEGGDNLDPNGGAGGNGGDGGQGGSACGAIYDTSGLLHLTNCTLAFNGASSQGGAGGIPGGPRWGWPGSPGPPGVTAGGINSIGCLLVNTLLATNSVNCYGWVADGGHNLSSDGTCAFTNAGSPNNVDPKLGPLANNGGPTLTMALLPGSPAIDAGNTSLAPATDQRGFPRPAGLAADIGAFEYGSVMPTLAVSRSGAIGLNILGSGNAGQSCRLVVSPDLLSWVAVATNQIGGDGTVLFQDICAQGRACRFYRLVMP
jgi:hypothetical protein